MKGSLREVAPGRYDLLVNVKDPVTGKWKQKSRRFHGGKRKAQEALAAFVTEVTGDGYIEPSKDTLGAYLEQWLAATKGTVSLRSWETYAYWIRKHAIPKLGTVPLSKLTGVQIRAAYAEMLENGRLDGNGGLSECSVANIHRILKEALKQAVQDGLLSSNPADRVKAPKPEPKEMKALDETETRTLLKAAEETGLLVPIVIAATTGMRRGEILALRWQDVDLERQTLTISQALEDLSGGVRFKSPKTKRSRRTIKLPLATVEVLRWWRVQQMAHRQKLEDTYDDHGLVFCRRDGKPLDPAGLSTRFRTFIKEAGLPPIRFHDLRHSHASQLLAQGAPINELSKRLGHSLTSITLNIYAHLLAGVEEKMLDTYEDRLNWQRAKGE